MTWTRKYIFTAVLTNYCIQPYYHTNGPLVLGPFRWLWQFAIMRLSHFSPQICKHSLHCLVPVPVPKRHKSSWVHRSIPSNTTHINLCFKSNLGRCVGIRFAAINLEGVNPTVVHRSWRPNDSASPVTHQHIIPTV